MALPIWLLQACVVQWAALCCVWIDLFMCVCVCVCECMYVCMSVCHLHHRVGLFTPLSEICNLQGKRIGVFTSIASNPNNDADVNAHFAQALADLRAAGM